MRGEEKWQYSNAFDYILKFVVLNKWIIGNPFVLFGITNIFRPVVKTNVRSKIISLTFYSRGRGIEGHRGN